MKFTNPRILISEAAAADLLDPEVSDEVKDVVEELEDDLDSIEEVPEKEKTTNGGIPVTAEAVPMLQSESGRYLVKLEDVIAVMETEGEAAAAAAAEAGETNEEGEAPTAEECEPEPVNVIEKIADANGVDAEDVAVVISTESVGCLAEASLLESGKGRKCGKNCKKLRKTKKTVDALKGKVALVKA